MLFDAHYSDVIDFSKLGPLGLQIVLQIVQMGKFGAADRKPRNPFSQASIVCPLCDTLGADTPVALRRRSAATGERNVKSSRN